MTYFFNTAFPKNAVILFFKATQLGLFEDIVPIKGHMRNGRFINPTMGKRRKANKPNLSGHLFGHIDDAPAQQQPAPEAKKPAPRKPRPLSPEKRALMQAKINQMLAHAKVDAQHAPKQGSVHKKLYLAQLEAMKGIPEDVLEKAKQDIEGLFGGGIADTPPEPSKENRESLIADRVRKILNSKPRKPRKPPALKPEKLEALRAEAKQILSRAKVDAQQNTAWQRKNVLRKLYLAKLSDLQGLPGDELMAAQAEISALFMPAPASEGNTNPAEPEKTEDAQSFAEKKSMEPFQAEHPVFGTMTVIPKNAPHLREGDTLVDVEFYRANIKLSQNKKERWGIDPAANWYRIGVARNNETGRLYGFAEYPSSYAYEPSRKSMILPFERLNQDIITDAREFSGINSAMKKLWEKHRASDSQQSLASAAPAPEKKPETDTSKIDYNAIKNTLRDNPSVETVLSVAETLGIGSTPKRYLGDTEIIRLGSIMGYKNPSSLPRDLAKEKARLDVVSVVGFINTKAGAAKAKSKASADASARVKAVMAHIDRKRSTGERLTDDEQTVLYHATAARTAHEDAAAHVSRANAMDQEWASDRAAGRRGTVDVLAATGLGPQGARNRAAIARAEAKKHQEKAVEAAQRVKVAAQPVSAAPAPEKKPEVAPAEPEKPDQSAAKVEPWHTPIPDRGMAVHPDDARIGSSGMVAHRAAAEAYAAIPRTTMDQGFEMYLYVLPATETHHGAARLLPDDQKAPKGWQLVSGKPYRPGFKTKDQVIHEIQQDLMRTPILAWGEPPKKQAPEKDKPTFRRSRRALFLKAGFRGIAT